MKLGGSENADGAKMFRTARVHGAFLVLVSNLIRVGNMILLFSMKNVIFHNENGI